jgi:hypothetical protein
LCHAVSLGEALPAIIDILPFDLIGVEGHYTESLFGQVESAWE